MFAIPATLALRLLLVLCAIADISATLRASTNNVETGVNARRQLQVDAFDESALCGCNSCSNDAPQNAGGFTCAHKIMGLIVDYRFTEAAACNRISKMEFAPECAEICDPNLCDGKGNFDEAETTYCGCDSCTSAAWNTDADGHSCGSRISYLTATIRISEKEACRTVGGVEYSAECRACDPDTCHQLNYGTTIATSVPQTPRPTPRPSPSSAPLSENNDEEPNVINGGETGNVDIENIPNYLDENPLFPETSLYCFPEYNNRKRYTNVWGKYTLEVKEGNSCGPSGNVFSRDTVSLQANTDTNKDELKLEFKKVGNNWEASEVRVLLPQAEMPYHYGNYSFSIKSVNVIDSSTGTVLDNALPVTMILGLFTWDATEDYAIHENYNHEVDIEIAQWNIPGQADIQYLVQPPGEPHKYRFYSGEGNTYNQAPHTYSFDWRPAEIEWNSDAGGGQSFTLTTQDALDAGKPDYIQCMPADVEVRLNLWHLFGDSQPSGLQDSHIVEVVIDDFQFTPNGLTALVDGSTCSKDCHCGPDSTCQNNRCTYVSPGANAEFRPSRSQSSSTVTNPPTADSTIFTNPPTDDSGSDQIIPVPSTPEADGDAGTGEVIISVEGNNTNSVGEDSTEDNVIASSFKAGDNGGSNRGGMKAGVSLLFIALTVAALVVNIRRRRDSASQSKMNDMISSNGLNKNVVVDTTVSDEETDKEASFEISVKEEDDSSILQRTLNQCLGSIKL